jgi:hypothetical protein
MSGLRRDFCGPNAELGKERDGSIKDIVRFSLLWTENYVGN